jgi:hypothetical protein
LGHGAPNPSQSLLAGNGFDAPAANIVAATQCLGRPKLPDKAVIGWVKTLHKPVSKKRPRLTGKRKRLLCNLFDGPAHGLRIRGAARKLNSIGFSHYHMLGSLPQEIRPVEIAQATTTKSADRPATKTMRITRAIFPTVVLCWKSSLQALQ